jgi:hypothetical protein
MEPVFHELLNFYQSDRFQQVMHELFLMPEDLRHDFVEEVLLSDKQLKARGVECPLGLEIQRTQFADQRPTLFAIVKKVQIGPWKKLTVTIDNTSGPFRPIYREAVDMDQFARDVSAG